MTTKRSLWTNLPEMPESSATTKHKTKKRHPFDIFEDQIEALKKRSSEDQMQGGIGSQSAMVREAVDDYLAKVQLPNATKRSH
jgi:hypothetical protein